MGRPIFVYGLCDPRTDELRYVGKSPYPEARVAGHIGEARSGTRGTNELKDAWILGLLDNGLYPSVFVIEETNDAEWKECERFWISYFKFVGCDLLNVRGVRKVIYRRTQRISDEEAQRRRQEYEEEEIRQMMDKVRRLSWQQRHVVRTLVDEFLRDDGAP